MVKNLPAMQETWVQSLGWEDPLEESMATHSSILAWRILMDRGGAWWATVHGAAKSQIWLHTCARHVPKGWGTIVNKTVNSSSPWWHYSLVGQRQTINISLNKSVKYMWFPFIPAWRYKAILNTSFESSGPCLCHLAWGNTWLPLPTWVPFVP